MTDDKRTSLDILGIGGISDSIKIATEKSLDGAAAFLSRVCLPAAEEFGLMLRDRVSAWRAGNATRILAYAHEKTAGQIPESCGVHPRLLHEAMDEGSWSDDEDVQQMWAGLLVSGLSSNGRSDENLVFTRLLKQLTCLQVKIIHFAILRANKQVSVHGLPHAESNRLTVDELVSAIGESDLYRLDRELDHLRQLALIDGGIHLETCKVDLNPTALALYLYVRCQGSKASPGEYFNATPPSRAR